MASEQVLAVNDSDFETTVEKNELPCLVDFWALGVVPARRSVR